MYDAQEMLVSLEAVSNCFKLAANYGEHSYKLYSEKDSGLWEYISRDICGITYRELLCCDIISKGDFESLKNNMRLILVERLKLDKNLTHAIKKKTRSVERVTPFVFSKTIDAPFLFTRAI